MAEFNRYVVTVDVESSGADYVMNEEVTFSVSAISIGAIKSALPLTDIPHVTDYEILEIKERNE